MELFALWGSVLIDNKDALKALKSVDKKGKSTSKKLGDIADKGLKIGTAIVGGATVAAGGLMTIANKTADVADAISKGAQKVGISTEAYQELDYWASQNGISHDNMEKAVGRFNQRMGQAQNGNEKYSAALKELGVDMEAVRNGSLSTEDAFAQSIQTLSQMENEQDKVNLATEMFGTKMAREMLPALNDGSLSLEDAKKKAAELGIVMSEDALAAGVEFTDTMDDAKRSLSTLGLGIGTEVMPMIQSMLDWFIANMPQIRETVGNAFEKIANVISWISDNTNILIPILTGLFGAFVALKVISIISAMMTAYTAFTTTATGVQLGLNAALMANPIGLVIAAIVALIAIGVALYMNWDKVKAMAVALWKKITTVFNDIKDSISSKVNQIKSTLARVFGAVKDIMLRPFNIAKSAISKVISKIKGFLSFKWSFPKIKLPKLPSPKITGSFSLIPPRTPKISWNADGGIFDQPTIFNTPYGLQGVGDAKSPEVVAPLHKLQDMLGLTDGDNGDSSEIVTLLRAILNKDINMYINEKRMNETLAPGMIKSMDKLKKGRKIGGISFV